MKLLLDTNIILEVILGQQKENEVKDLFSKIEEHEFFVTDFTIHSIGLLLFRQKQYRVFLEFLSDILAEGGIYVVRLNQDDLKKVTMVSQHSTLDFDDAYQYVVAEKYNLTIISFDSDFDRTKRGRKLPSQVLK